MVHARDRSLRTRLWPRDPNAIKRVFHARIWLPKAELVDLVGEIKQFVSKRSNVVDMHVALLERPARGKVEVPCNLIHLMRAQGLAVGISSSSLHPALGMISPPEKISHLEPPPHLAAFSFLLCD